MTFGQVVYDIWPSSIGHFDIVFEVEYVFRLVFGLYVD